jgi:peptidyl-prolyl cis-trans isomerase SurA
MEPAVRKYLHQLREEAFIDYKPGYVDTAAVVNASKPVYSAYAPPAPKKKKSVVRTRYRQKARSSKSRQTAALPNVPSLADVPQSNSASATGPATPATSNPSATTTTAAASAPAANAGDSKQKTRLSASTASSNTMKPGKKEKIRFGQAPRETLPKNDNTREVDAGSTSAGGNEPAAGATPETQVASNVTPLNADIPPTQAAEPKPQKKRFSDRAKLPKEKKPKGPQADPFAPPPVTDEETAAQKTQSAPLGLAGDTSKKAKKPKPTHKTRLQDELKPADQSQPAPATPDTTPPPTPPAAPANSGTPAPAPQN